MNYYQYAKCSFQSSDREEVKNHMDEKHEPVTLEEDVEFLKQVPRGFKNNNDEDKKTKTKKEDIKDKVCPYLRKGHCNFSLSGRKPFKGVSQCPYLHPRTCPKLLNNGSKGKYGCDGSKCGMLHPKMCQVYLNYQKCIQDCRQGYHVRSNSKIMLDKKKEQEKSRRYQEEQKRRQEEDREVRRHLHQTNNTKPLHNLNVPPPTTITGQNEEQTTASFLAQIRKEVVQVLLAVLPVVSSTPGGPNLAQLPVPSPATAPGPMLSWAEALRRLQ